MKNHILGGLALFFAATVLPSGAEALIPTTVNCPAESIAVAIDSGFDEITVNGTCTENVVIRQDDITIQGDGNDTVIGQLWLEAARRITIQNLTINGGPEHGIAAVNGAAVTVRNLVIENVPGAGVILTGGGSALLDHVTIRNATFGVAAGGGAHVDVVNGSLIEQIATNGADIFNGASATLNQATIREANTGVAAYGNAYVEVSGSLIENNIDAGISLHRGADALLTGSTIQNNGGAGILLDTNCAAIGGDMPIIGNAGDGVGIVQGSTAAFENLTIQNNGGGIDINRGSSGNISNSTIENNGEFGIHVGYSSTANLDSNTIQATAIGVGVEWGASALLRNNAVTSTVSDDGALDMDWGAFVRLAGGNILTASPIGFSIFMQQGSTLNQQRELDTVKGPVWIRSASNAEFRKIHINGNVQVEDHSLLRLRELSNDGNVAVTGNISVSRDSGLNFVGGLPVQVHGNINCADQESSLGTDNLVLTGSKNGCTGYNNQNVQN